jgi:hypothetical protein
MRPKHPFPIGAIVRTPTGRMAKVVAYREDRCEILYTDAKPMAGRSADSDRAVLKPSLLTWPQ